MGAKKYIFLLIMCMLCNYALAQLNTKNILLVGRNALYYDDYTEAIKHFSDIITVKPYLPEPYFFRAVAKISLEDYRGALIDCNKAIKLNPNYVYAYIHRGIAKHNLKDYEGAMQDYDFVSTLAPNSAINYANRGITKANMANYSGAMADYDLALKYDKSLMGVYLNRAIVCTKIKDMDGALKNCNKAIQLNMFSSDAYNARGYIKYLQKKYKSSILDYDKAVDLDKDNAKTYMMRALSKYELNDIKGALGDYDKALEIDTYSSVALFNRALLKAEVGDVDSALDDLDKALIYNPNNILFHYNKGIINLLNKSYMQAIKSFDKAIEIYPQFAKAYLSRYEAKRKLNKTKEAKLDLKIGLKIIKENSKVKSVDELASYQDTTANFKRLIDINLEGLTDGDISDGRIQNKNVIIRLLGGYRTVICNKNGKNSGRLLTYEKHIAEYNAKNGFKPTIHLASGDIKADSVHQSHLKNDFLKSIAYLDRGDYHKAIKMCSSSIAKDSENILAYLNRGYAYTIMLEYIAKFKDSQMPKFVDNDKSSYQSFLDYSKAIDDYSKIINIDDKFTYAYYNRANIYAKSNKIEQALSDYNQVLRLDSYFAEAYYNRGIVKIYKNDLLGASVDLSKAGELGIKSAYNVIKRYCNK